MSQHDELKESFEELGLSAQDAEIAARGRATRSTATRSAPLIERLQRQVDRCDAAWSACKAEGRLTAEIAADLVRMRGAAMRRLQEARTMEREQEVADFADRYGTGAASNSNTATNSNSKSHVALAESFEQLGLSPTDAAVAARGR